MADPLELWHPVATSDDLPPRHVFHGQLLGRELAVWRADDNFVNVWENRCLHRGVRLSIGTNDGNELTCRYHGWRYSSRSAGCTYIPAHPADAPARTICNRVFPAVEKYGLVWSGAVPHGQPPKVPMLDVSDPFALRSLPVNASVEMTLRHLAEHTFQPVGLLDGHDAAMTVTSRDDWSVTLTASDSFLASSVVFFVQPVDAARSVIRPVLTETPEESGQLAAWRHHASRLSAVVTAAEANAAAVPAPAPMVATINRVSLALSTVPARSAGRLAPLRVQVSRKWTTALDIAAFELTPIGGSLPTFQPGAHIDVHLPNGLVRQYSVTNGPGETSFYRIAVKRIVDSTGGSACLHDTVNQGDVLAISEPRNNFPLRRDALNTLLIAGGIGVTPLLAMAQTLQAVKLDFQLHYFARAEQEMAFASIRERLGESLVAHLGLSHQDTAAALQDLLQSPDGSSQVYLCGPGPMLETSRRIAAEAGWPDHAVHFEYFQNTTEIDDSSSFEIALARSALTLQVRAGETILDVLRANDVPIPSSCEQGACGTCVVPVLEGEIDHHDVYLNNTDHLAGDRIMTCVSRATSDRLVLDL